MKIGFIGLGQMGRPIAHNLRRDNETLIVSDRDNRHFAEFAAEGAAGSIALFELAGCDVSFLCLPNAAVVQQILLGEEGCWRT